MWVCGCMICKIPADEICSYKIETAVANITGLSGTTVVCIIYENLTPHYSNIVNTCAVCYLIYVGYIRWYGI